MQIIVNGESKEYKNSATLGFVIDDLKIRDKVMAAALNTQIVKKDECDSCSLKNSDKIELLHFVGGG
jgi:sulfur carrier protein